MKPPSASDLQLIEQFTIIEYISFAVSFVVNAIAFWLTLRHSTSAASTFRFYLLSIQIPSFLSDVVGSLSNPVAFLPTFCCLVDGIAGRSAQSHLGPTGIYILASVLVGGCSYCVCAYLACLHYRHQAVQLPSSPWKMKKKSTTRLLLFMVAVFTLPPISFICAGIYDRRRLAVVIAENFGLWPLSLTERIVCLDMVGVAVFAVFMILIVGASEMMLVTLTVHTLLSLNGNHALSKAGARYHRQMMQSLLIQVFVSNAALTIPCVVIFGQVLLGASNLAITMGSVKLLCAHSPIHCVVLIGSSPSYRRAMATALGLRKKPIAKLSRSRSNWQSEL